MPYYDFACQRCGQPFEKKLSMAQSGDPQTCPSCGSEETRRRLSAAFSVGGGSRAAKPVTRPPSSPFT